MKTFLCVAVLALVASAMASPLSDRARVQSLLATMQDDAELQSFWNTLKNVGKTALKVGTGLLSGGRMQVEEEEDDDDDDGLVAIQSLLAAAQNDAELQGFLSSVGGFLKKHGPGILNAANGLVNGGRIQVEEEEDDDDDDDGLVAIQSLLAAAQNDAELQGFLSSVGGFLKKHGPGILNAANGLVNGGRIQDMHLKAALQNMDRAEAENFLSTLGKIGKGVLGAVVGKK